MAAHPRAHGEDEEVDSEVICRCGFSRHDDGALAIALDSSAAARRCVLTSNAQVLIAAIVLYGSITLAQLLGAWYARSLALLVDCASMLVDVISYVGAAWHELYSKAHEGERAVRRNEMIVSALSLAALWGVTIPGVVGAIAVIAERRRLDRIAAHGVRVEREGGADVDPWLMLAFALAGLVCDALSLVCFLAPPAGRKGTAAGRRARAKARRGLSVGERVTHATRTPRGDSAPLANGSAGGGRSRADSHAHGEADEEALVASFSRAQSAGEADLPACARVPPGADAPAPARGGHAPGAACAGAPGRARTSGGGAARAGGAAAEVPRAGSAVSDDSATPAGRQGAPAAACAEHARAPASTRTPSAPAAPAGEAPAGAVNMRSAFAHVFADSCRSLSTAIAALLILLRGLDPQLTDAVCSLVVALFVVSASAGVCRLWCRQAGIELRRARAARRWRAATTAARAPSPRAARRAPSADGAHIELRPASTAGSAQWREANACADSRAAATPAAAGGDSSMARGVATWQTRASGASAPQVPTPRDVAGWHDSSAADEAHDQHRLLPARGP